MKGWLGKRENLKDFKDKKHITQKEQEYQIIIIHYMVVLTYFINSWIINSHTWYERAVNQCLQSVEEKTVKLEFYNEQNYYLNVRLEHRYFGAYSISQ